MGTRNGRIFVRQERQLKKSREREREKEREIDWEPEGENETVMENVRAVLRLNLMPFHKRSASESNSFGYLSWT